MGKFYEALLGNETGPYGSFSCLSTREPMRISTRRFPQRKGRKIGTLTNGGSFFVLFKSVLRVGAQAIFPFKRLFKGK